MKSKYGRPSPDARFIKDQSLPLIFQIVDADYVQEAEGVRLRFFGMTQEGQSICCSASTYVPYFYVEAPKGYKNKNQLDAYTNYLNTNLPKNLGIQQRNYVPAGAKIVKHIEEVRGASVYHYTDNMDQLFLKIHIISPRLITQCKNTFLNLVHEPLMFYEANIDFELRFMNDLNMVGCCWIEISPRDYSIVTNRKETICQLEVRTNIQKIKVHPPDEDPWGDIAPLRVLSFDIECASDPGVFPIPQKHPVIQIGCVCKEQGKTEVLFKTCFVLGSCAVISGADIIECTNEVELLKSWADFVREVDPDIMTGYNIQNFDFPYIFDRAKALKIEEYVTSISRLSHTKCKYRETTLSSNQMGTRTNKLVDIDGRIIFDLYQVVLRDYKLRSYTLNNVSYHFLNEQKEDVEHNMITVLHNGSDQDRRRLAMYCLKDADLPMKLLDKLMFIVNYVEMARVTGVPWNFLITRGQQVRILAQLLRKAKSMNYLLPVLDRLENDEGYEGATVIEPTRGFYNQPIATLDFASLYPSIMIAHNICYTTCVMRPPANMIEGEDYIKTPSGNYFITEKHKRGLLPLILEDLISARKKAKNDLKKATDPLKKIVLNGRQLALKISANSVYGFTGATVGKLPCVEISQSVTAFGRQMIGITKEMVEKTYKKGEYDMKKNAVVIYGDTDSVMVDFGADSVGEAMKFGNHAAALISKVFKPPIKLEFEKVYCPYLLIQKKRYAGLYFTKPDIHDKIDTKGLETIRRDNCPLVGMVMNTCLELMLIDRDPPAAIDYAKRVIADLLQNRVDTSMLIISKELTKTNDDYRGKQAHAVLAERMRKRDPATAPKLGDRVPYVIIAKGSNVPAFEKAEDPLYVLKNKIPIDTNYYLHHQLLKPLVRLFDSVTNNKAESMLAHGDHTRSVKQVVSKTTGMGVFTVKKQTCMECKCILQGENPAPVCKNCEKFFSKIYTQKVMELRMAQNRFGRLWTECQNCGEDLNNEINCGAKDCPIFYMREKARVDFEEKANAVRRFDYYNELYENI